MPATVIAERIEWPHGISILNRRAGPDHVYLLESAQGGRSAVRGVSHHVECGERRLGELSSLEEIAMDDLVQCSE